MRWLWAISLWLCAASLARAGEIIIVDPAREKAQALPQPTQPTPRHDELRARALDDARARSGREMPPSFIEIDPEMPAERSAREARGYLDDGAVPPAPTLIIKNGPPPTEATQMREKARAWVAPPAANPLSRCRTENTVGGIEGNVQGHTVIQGNSSGVIICK